MDLTYWVLLSIFVVYLLFNIKKVIHSIAGSFTDNGSKFTLGLIAFVLIFIIGCFVGVLAPNYSWIPQWAIILYIVGFFIYRLTKRSSP